MRSTGWVGGEEFVYKPVALLNAAPWATHAQASLTETVTVMSARLVAEASIAVPLRAKNLDPAAIAASPELADPLCAALEAFARAIEGFRSPLSD
jgi:hypothetical protein